MTSAPQSLTAAFASGCACRWLDESHRKIQLFLSVGALDRAARQVSLMTQAAGYLKANFPPAALAKGPIAR